MWVSFDAPSYVERQWRINDTYCHWSGRRGEHSAKDVCSVMPGAESISRKIGWEQMHKKKSGNHKWNESRRWEFHIKPSVLSWVIQIPRFKSNFGLLNKAGSYTCSLFLSSPINVSSTIKWKKKEKKSFKFLNIWAQTCRLHLPSTPCSPTDVSPGEAEVIVWLQGNPKHRSTSGRYTIFSRHRRELFLP